MSAVLSASATVEGFGVADPSPAEVGAALRRARIALALPVESFARELRLPTAQMRAIEAGLPGPFDDLAQRTEATLRALRRLSLPTAWAAFQPELAVRKASPEMPSGTAPGAARAGAARTVPALVVPPISSRARRIGAVATAMAIVGAAVVASLMPAEETALEDMPGHARADEPAPQDATPADPAARVPQAQAMPGATRGPDATGSASTPRSGVAETGAAPAQALAATSSDANPALPTPSAPSDRTDAVSGPVATGRPRDAAATAPVYAVLPGSVVVLPERPVIEVHARTDTVVELLTEHGASNFALHGGDRIVLSSGRADRLVVADREAVEVRVAGRPVSLDPIAGQAAGRWNGPAR